MMGWDEMYSRGLYPHARSWAEMKRMKHSEQYLKFQPGL